MTTQKRDGTAEGKTANMSKYRSYRLAFAQIRRAIDQGFPIEAISIEEGIISDRLQSAAEGKGIALKSVKKARTANFSELVGKVKSETAFATLRDEFVVKGLSVEDMETWGKSRNDFVHNIVHSTPGTAPVVESEQFLPQGIALAKQGLKIARLICAWSKKDVFIRKQSKVPNASKPSNLICAAEFFGLSDNSEEIDDKKGGHETGEKTRKAGFYLEITVWGYAEQIFGSIPDNVFDYIRAKFDGCMENYLEAVAAGKVPAKYRWISDINELTDKDDIDHMDYPTEMEIKVLKHGDDTYERSLTKEEIQSCTEVHNDNWDFAHFTAKGCSHFFSWRVDESDATATYTIEIGNRFVLSELDVIQRVDNVFGKCFPPPYYLGVGYGSAGSYNHVDFEPPTSSGGLNAPEIELF